MTETSKPQEVIFEPLPEAKLGRKSGGWKETLIARPGEWARLPIAPNGLPSMKHRCPGFELVTRTVDGERRSYGRYVGENGEHA